MNAIAKSQFAWLLKREYWESRRGFFWAQVITAGVIVGISILGIITAEVFRARMGVQFGGPWGGANLNEMLRSASQHDILQLVNGLDMTLLMFAGIASVVLCFVMFFYLLGSLYDDRRDRSILFWKSLPVSDSQMVLSKLAWALVLAPVLAVAIGLLIGLALWLISALTITVNGVPAAHAVFTQSHPLRIIGGVLACLPVYMAWALPTIGWLMFCSAAARSKPFLWAVLVPVLACVVISMTTILPGVDIAHDRVWYTLAYRGLLSAVPGAWFPTISGVVDTSGAINTPDDLAGAINLARSWQAFASADLWIGAVVGIALIAAAIRLRRWRDEG